MASGNPTLTNVTFTHDAQGNVVTKEVAAPVAQVNQMLTPVVFSHDAEGNVVTKGVNTAAEAANTISLPAPFISNINNKSAATQYSAESADAAIGSGLLSKPVTSASLAKNTNIDAGSIVNGELIQKPFVSSVKDQPTLGQQAVKAAEQNPILAAAASIPIVGTVVKAEIAKSGEVSPGVVEIGKGMYGNLSTLKLVSSENGGVPIVSGSVKVTEEVTKQSEPSVLNFVSNLGANVYNEVASAIPFVNIPRANATAGFEEKTTTLSYDQKVLAPFISQNLNGYKGQDIVLTTKQSDVTTEKSLYSDAGGKIGSSVLQPLSIPDSLYPSSSEAKALSVIGGASSAYSNIKSAYLGAYDTIRSNPLDVVKYASEGVLLSGAFEGVGVGVNALTKGTRFEPIVSTLNAYKVPEIALGATVGYGVAKEVTSDFTDFSQTAAYKAGQISVPLVAMGFGAGVYSNAAALEKLAPTNLLGPMGEGGYVRRAAVGYDSESGAFSFGGVAKETKYVKGFEPKEIDFAKAGIELKPTLEMGTIENPTVAPASLIKPSLQEPYAIIGSAKGIGGTRVPIAEAKLSEFVIPETQSSRLLTSEDINPLAQLDVSFGRPASFKESATVAEFQRTGGLWPDIYNQPVSARTLSMREGQQLWIKPTTGAPLPMDLLPGVNQLKLGPSEILPMTSREAAFGLKLEIQPISRELAGIKTRYGGASMSNTMLEQIINPSISKGVRSASTTNIESAITRISAESRAKPVVEAATAQKIVPSATADVFRDSGINKLSVEDMLGAIESAGKEKTSSLNVIPKEQTELKVSPIVSERAIPTQTPYTFGPTRETLETYLTLQQRSQRGGVSSLAQRIAEREGFVLGVTSRSMSDVISRLAYRENSILNSVERSENITGSLSDNSITSLSTNDMISKQVSSSDQYVFPISKTEPVAVQSGVARTIQDLKETSKIQDADIFPPPKTTIAIPVRDRITTITDISTRFETTQSPKPRETTTSGGWGRVPIGGGDTIRFPPIGGNYSGSGGSSFEKKKGQYRFINIFRVGIGIDNSPIPNIRFGHSSMRSGVRTPSFQTTPSVRPQLRISQTRTPRRIKF